MNVLPSELGVFQCLSILIMVQKRGKSNSQIGILLVHISSSEISISSDLINLYARDCFEIPEQFISLYFIEFHVLMCAHYYYLYLQILKWKFGIYVYVATSPISKFNISGLRLYTIHLPINSPFPYGVYKQTKLYMYIINIYITYCQLQRHGRWYMLPKYNCLFIDDRRAFSINKMCVSTQTELIRQLSNRLPSKILLFYTKH